MSRWFYYLNRKHDDVVVRLKNGESIGTIYEQDKASVKKKYPFTNMNVNLWAIRYMLTAYKCNGSISESKSLQVLDPSFEKRRIIKKRSL